MDVNFEWRGAFGNDEINELHAAAFGTRVFSAAEWNWVELTAGPHEVCFGRVAGYTQPARRTVEVLPGTAVATTGV